MTHPILVTGAAGRVGGVGGLVVQALRRHLAELGAGAGIPITADGAEPGRS